MRPVKRYFNQVDAILAKTLLEDYEIDSVLFDEHLNALAYIIAFPVRLMVADPQLERAARILYYAEKAVVPSDEEAAVDHASVRTVDEEIFGEREDELLEPIASSQPDNPWQVLAIAYLFLIPGIGFMLECHWLLLYVGGRRDNGWVMLSPYRVHLLGSALIAIALALTVYYFKVRREMVRGVV